MTFIESASAPQDVMPPMTLSPIPHHISSPANLPDARPLIGIDVVSSVQVVPTIPTLPGSESVVADRDPKLMDDIDDDDDVDDDGDDMGDDIGIEDPDQAPDTGFSDDLDDDDDLDEFDDIDEDDFDDDFDDDFEEELDDDYEIEIDDEISNEFGLNTAGGPGEPEDEGLDDFEDFDNIAR